MEVSERPKARSVSDGDRRTQRNPEHRGGRLQESNRLLVRLGAGTAGLIGIPGTAGAHGGSTLGGTPVTFAAVVGLPIIAGLGGGAVAVRRWRADHTSPANHRVDITLGLLLVVLGMTFAITAVTERLWLGLTGSAVGTLSAVWAARRDGTVIQGCHAKLTFGAVLTHRWLEGVVLGTLYSSGAAVGLLGAVIVTGHTAVETTAVGGLYGQYRLPAVWAVVFIQVGYAIGAIVGLGVAETVPPSIRIGLLALAGGVLLGIGMNESRCSANTGLTSLQ